MLLEGSDYGGFVSAEYIGLMALPVKTHPASRERGSQSEDLGPLRKKAIQHPAEERGDRRRHNSSSPGNWCSLPAVDQRA